LPPIEHFLGNRAPPPPWRSEPTRDAKKRRAVLEVYSKRFNSYDSENLQELQQDMVIKGMISSVRTFGLLVHIQQVLHYVNGQRIKDKQNHFGELHLLENKVNLVNALIDERNYNYIQKKKGAMLYSRVNRRKSD